MEPRVILASLSSLILLGGCAADSPSPMMPPDGDGADRIVEGVNLTTLFAPPAPAERDAIEAEWATRDVSARDVRVVREEAMTLGGAPATLRILSHLVDGSTHYGAIIAPEGAPGSLPVVVYGHGGDDGFDVDELSLLAGALGSAAAGYVFIAPSFRSEPLVLDGTTYLSGGEASPWDRDVDDALALLTATAQVTPQADPTRVGIVGLSRGAGVGLLMAIREPEIDVVVEFFGPTDFFGEWVQGITEDALRGELADLPGLDVLDERFIQPLRSGALTEAEVRPELIRRSAVLFAAELPDTQIHHGTADMVVDVSQAESLIAALEALGRGEPEDQFFLYAGAGHDPFGMPLSIPRTVDFIGRLDAGAGMAADVEAVARSLLRWDAAKDRLVRRQ